MFNPFRVRKERSLFTPGFTGGYSNLTPFGVVKKLQNLIPKGLNTNNAGSKPVAK